MIKRMDLNLAPTWQPELQPTLDSKDLEPLQQFLQEQLDGGRSIYPPQHNWFRAFEITPLPAVKVVIIGQDPYHQFGQAHGLCFSVLPGTKVPPSLVNIYKELASDLRVEPVKHGYLESWAEQGVLLLNAVLTVEESKANAHQGLGWELFTDKVIELVNEKCDSVVFLLWGGYAQKKGSKIDQNKHCVLRAPHPSPLSAYRGFFGCGHFSQTNDYLQNVGKEPINWQLPVDVQVTV